MALIRRRNPQDFNPYRNLMTRFIDDDVLPAWLGEVQDVPLDIYEEDSKVFVKASLPGIKPDDLKIEVNDDILSISGEVKEDKEDKDKNYYCREQRYGHFERSVRLPHTVDADKAEVKYEAGVLMLTLPETEGDTRKQIKVETKN